ncbi:MAG: iron-sulfur cluster assembly accessory protein [Wolbachia pipientis]|nr:iron-sulfur cluster assembly accessory protein [Wolbachia pipientis]
MSIDYNVNLTNSALRKIRSLIEQEGDKGYILRIAILGGGCSGFKYSFLMDQINKDLSSDDEDDNYSSEFNDNNEGIKDYKSGFDLRKKNKNEDIVVNDENGKPILMIDSYSAKFLSNSVIDYTEDLNGSGFQVSNSLAKSQCGCGSSFSV